MTPLEDMRYRQLRLKYGPGVKVKEVKTTRRETTFVIDTGRSTKAISVLDCGMTKEQ